jgi:hypothetical protein
LPTSNAIQCAQDFESVWPLISGGMIPSNQLCNATQHVGH